ncbi:hypothetical protein BU23DRAFT_574299 [Bimuria novae-zelandiae CBS 107.79]|uniref:Uncharacterized protein n=1 Tax=Bimuria novae-zelandiae CBS 107.79 TaxID=1447943 RepID=A0A6A5UMW8_9PLEO|nr:hypothetical protein BU23DRAFT_574299 [Bimuria novae-zelandiae CBS 107.79]
MARHASSAHMSTDSLIKLSRAAYKNDAQAVGEAWLGMIGKGRMGDRDVEEWANLEWLDETDEENFYLAYMVDPDKDEHHRILAQKQMVKEKRKAEKRLEQTSEDYLIVSGFTRYIFDH